MNRRVFVKSALGVAAAGIGGGLMRAAFAAQAGPAVSVDTLAALEGELTVYLGHGEGGLYGDVLEAIRKRNPRVDVAVRRGPSAALANTLVAESRAGGARADLFWSIDAGSLGVVVDEGMAREGPASLHEQVKPEFRYTAFVPVSGRIRTVVYNTERVRAAEIPASIMAFPQTRFTVAWAPSYGAFQSFITAMRLLEGDAATAEWLKAMKPRAKEFSGEFGAVMAVARGQVDVAFANHYYALRLKQAKPEVALALAFTRGDAGALVNTAGVVLLNDKPVAADFIRYLLTREVQSYLVQEAFEIPMVSGVAGPPGLNASAHIEPPEVDLRRLSNLRPTLALMREVGVL